MYDEYETFLFQDQSSSKYNKLMTKYCSCSTLLYTKCHLKRLEFTNPVDVKWLTFYTDLDLESVT